MHSPEFPAVVRVFIAFGLTFVLGFERQVRGSAAGDRTFSLVGVAAAVIGVLSAQGSLSILSGAVTGVGFIGAGLLFRQNDHEVGVVHGVTTAAAILAAAGIGAAAGEGQVWVATVATFLILLILELQYIPVLRVLDAGRWAHRFKGDDDERHRRRHLAQVIERQIIEKLPHQRNHGVKEDREPTPPEAAMARNE